MKTILLFPDPAEGGTPPAAAETVVNSNAKETDAAENIRLKHQLESERGKAKALAEENARLKTPPQPVPEKKQGGIADWLF